MKHLLLILPLLMLTACVDQETADAKMVKGCEAGISALLEGDTLAGVKGHKAETKDFQGEGNHRFVTIDVIEKDGWMEFDKSYTCVFLEEWGAMRSSHKALLIQLKVNDRIYGKDNGVITGDWDDFLGLTRVVDKAMGQ